MVTKIISGAQTGADRAGLDAGLYLGLQVGGWIPKGRRTDEGPLSLDNMLRYGLTEHSSSDYPPRTLANVMEGDATLLFGNMDSPGCRLTIRLCKQHGKPYRVMYLYDDTSCAGLWAWLLYHDVNVLNVAGNRERTNPGIYQSTFDTLIKALSK